MSSGSSADSYPRVLSDGISASAGAQERVAQSVEHLPFKQRVPGSNPGALTIKM